MFRVLTGWRAMGEGESAACRRALGGRHPLGGDRRGRAARLLGSVAAIFLGDDRAWGALRPGPSGWPGREGPRAPRGVALGAIAAPLPRPTIRRGGRRGRGGGGARARAGRAEFHHPPHERPRRRRGHQGRRRRGRSSRGETLERATVTGWPARPRWRRGRWPTSTSRAAGGRGPRAPEAVSDVRPGHGDALLAVIALPDTIEAAVRAGQREGRCRCCPPSRPGRPIRARRGPGRGWPASGPARGGEDATAHFEEALGCRPTPAPSTSPGSGSSTASTCAASGAGWTPGAPAGGDRGLRALGGVPWADRARAELRASGETARTPRPEHRLAADAPGAPGGPVRGPGAVQQGGRRAALPLAAHDRRPPPERLRQAGRDLAHPARPHLAAGLPTARARFGDFADATPRARHTVGP